MFCRKCGKKIEDGNKFCTYCGEEVLPIGYVKKEEIKLEENKEVQDAVTKIEEGQCLPKESTEVLTNGKLKKDKPSFWYNILGFFMPITAVLLYLLKSDEQKLKCKSMLKWAIGGCITKFVLAICLIITYILLFAFVLTFGGVSTIFDDNIKDDHYYDYKYDIDDDDFFNDFKYYFD